MADLVDRDTALSVAAGAVMGAKGFSFWSALAVTGGLTAITLLVSRARPDLIPERHEPTFERTVVDAAATMVSWWVGKEVFPHPARQIAAETSPR